MVVVTENHSAVDMEAEQVVNMVEHMVVDTEDSMMDMGTLVEDMEELEDTKVLEIFEMDIMG